MRGSANLQQRRQDEQKTTVPAQNAREGTKLLSEASGLNPSTRLPRPGCQNPNPKTHMQYYLGDRCINTPRLDCRERSDILETSTQSVDNNNGTTKLARNEGRDFGTMSCSPTPPCGWRTNPSFTKTLTIAKKLIRRARVAAVVWCGSPICSERSFRTFHDASCHSNLSTQPSGDMKLSTLTTEVWVETFYCGTVQFFAITKTHLLPQNFAKKTICVMLRDPVSIDMI